MDNTLDYLFKPIVLVTGFGPFVNHPVNASWEAVKRMNKEELERKHNIELVLLEIPVTYHNVDEFVPALWETHEPKLMIHVGVSSVAKEITVETQAHRKGYSRQDYYDQRPANHVCPAEGAVRLQTQLNVERIIQEYNNSSPEETSAVSSLDAGRYLCEYIYYTSLAHDNKRTLFVHVPDTPIYSPDQTARGLERILESCMTQIQESEDATNLSEQLDKATLCDNETRSSKCTSTSPIPEVPPSYYIHIQTPSTEDSSLNSILNKYRYGRPTASTSKDVKIGTEFTPNCSSSDESKMICLSSASKSEDSSHGLKFSNAKGTSVGDLFVCSDASKYSSSKNSKSKESSTDTNTTKESSSRSTLLQLKEALEHRPHAIAENLKEIFSRKDLIPEPEQNNVPKDP